MFRIGDKRANRLFLLCWFAYFCCYLMRYNYGAVLTEILTAENMTKVQAGLVSSAFFFAYGVGQILSGILGDRIRPYRLMFIGLACSGLLNLAMILAPNPILMTVIWGLNGVAQSMMWPPLVRMMAENYDPATYKKAVVNIAFTYPAATVGVYLLGPLFISISGWRLFFLFDALCGVIMATCWILFVPGLVKKERSVHPAPGDLPEGENGGPTAKMGTVFWMSGIFPMLLAIVCHGVIRDGVPTWIPRMLNEVFGLENTNSILITVLLPIFTFLALKLTAWLNTLIFKNEVKCALALFTVAFAASLLLYTVGKKSVLFTVLLAAITVASIHGINLMLICQVPGHFEKYNCISTVSGILNAFTYVGSVLSTYGFAVIIENFGWNTMILSWILLSAGGIFFSLLTLGKWTSFLKK